MSPGGTQGRLDGERDLLKLPDDFEGNMRAPDASGTTRNSRKPEGDPEATDGEEEGQAAASPVDRDGTRPRYTQLDPYSVSGSCRAL
jgi:hypothetical protein